MRSRGRRPRITSRSSSCRTAALAEQRIQTSVHYPPIHTFSQYVEAGAKRPLPQTEAVSRRLLTLPLHAHMSDEQADAVVEVLLEAV